ncbi:hypothetical protein A2856_02410 [Candidatus Uhrbacteria bacterium RIFCSPHIGHO2_01_FULL_63_20]|uniref:Nucleoside 2-deoxyribosyltransferase n=1 Tax=Candidatus Uhrbacteria bacterium RIFCSPHIGHO2_01_FULL_63_20 TaxID=1802385 RepID=A0A1F7TKL5_9BACT|nr:MAG: hypothetical protein A2856_02410 [Candidatus Uhrbacteria bacterium RIFCSPHIGHO2_01_FULL_63_20]
MKFRSQAIELIRRMRKTGIDPLFPDLEQTVENRDVAATTDEKIRFAWNHYRAIEQAEAVYFLVPSGYMGTSCKLEVGYAIAMRKPIFFSEKTGDMGLDGYAKAFVHPDEIDRLKGF